MTRLTTVKLRDRLEVVQQRGRGIWDEMTSDAQNYIEAGESAFGEHGPMSRYTIPPDYSGGDSDDRAALIGWQNDELSSESAWLRVEARRWDKPTPEDMQKVRGFGRLVRGSRCTLRPATIRPKGEPR